MVFCSGVVNLMFTFAFRIWVTEIRTLESNQANHGKNVISSDTRVNCQALSTSTCQLSVNPSPAFQFPTNSTHSSFQYWSWRKRPRKFRNIKVQQELKPWIPCIDGSTQNMFKMITYTSIIRSVMKWNHLEFFTFNRPYSRLNLMKFSNKLFAVFTVAISSVERGSSFFHAIGELLWFTVTDLINTVTRLSLKKATTESSAQSSDC